MHKKDGPLKARFLFLLTLFYWFITIPADTVLLVRNDTC